MDNYYQNCPPKSYSKGLSNYKSSWVNNELIKSKNGIVRDDDYRLFLQMNAEKLMDSEWLNLRQTQSCWNNACVHDFPMRQNPVTFVQERQQADLLFKTNVLPPSVKCPSYVDYRMTKTPMSGVNVGKIGCNGNC